jgi:hypothetical protein
MESYVKNILAPYCQRTRNHLNKSDAIIYLIMDNCAPHKTEKILAMYASIGVRVIWLPPHSGHFLQPLDLTLFGFLKKVYTDKSQWTKPEKATIQEAKILRIDEAWTQASHSHKIILSWQAAAFELHWGAIHPWVVNDDKVLAKISKNCTTVQGNPQGT